MIIVKVGGSVICSGGLDKVVGDVEPGMVLIHGGGCLVNEVMGKMGIKPIILRHPNGYTSRYTDEEALKAYVMTMMYINKVIVSKLNARGLRAIGLSGADLTLFKARRKGKVLIIDDRGRERVIDAGFSGRVEGVDVDALNMVLKMSDVVVLSPIVQSPQGELLNIDGDQMVEALSLTLKPSNVVILTNVDGVLVNGKPVAKVNGVNLSEVLPHAVGGMRRKLEVAVKLAKAGIRVVIANGVRDKPIRAALNGLGTVVEP